MMIAKREEARHSRTNGCGKCGSVLPASVTEQPSLFTHHDRPCRRDRQSDPTGELGQTTLNPSKQKRKTDI